MSVRRFVIFITLFSFSIGGEEKGNTPLKKEDQAKETSVMVEEQLDEIDRTKLEPRISNKWFRGNYLIYDCDGGYFACVNHISYRQCENQRKERIDDRNPQLGCTPLKRFKIQKDCFKVQYQKLENQTPKTFCLHPRLR